MIHKILYAILIIGLVVLACKQTPKILDKKNTALLKKSAQDPMADYKAQKHRFEIKTCKLYYNGQQVILDSLHLFEKVMGENYVYGRGYYYKDKPVSFNARVLKRGDTLEMVYSLAIKLSNNADVQRKMDMGSHSRVKKRDSMNYDLPTLKGYVLIDGQLVDVNTKIEDFNRNRKEEDLPLFSSLLGMSRSQGITYYNTYCQPAYNAKAYTNVTLLFNDENLYEEDYKTTTIWELRYNYTN